MKSHALLNYVIHIQVCNNRKERVFWVEDRVGSKTFLSTAMKRELSLHLQGIEPSSPRVRLTCLSEKTYFSVA